MTRRKTDENGTPAGYTRPVWPWPEIVRLTAHPSGQWSKKHKGRVYYFGAWSEPAEALRRWRLEWPRIVEGKPRHRAPTSNGNGSLTLEAGCTEFLRGKLSQYDRGDLAWPSYVELRAACRLVENTLGKHRTIDTVDAGDAADLMAATAHLSPIKRQATIVKIRTILRKIGKQAGVTVDLGDDFKGPPAKLIRQQRRQRFGRTFSPTVIRLLYYATYAQPKLRACILLGINAGFDASALSELRTADVDLARGWIENQRPKTLADRKAPLWPETIRAIRAIHDPGRDRLIVSEQGAPLIHKGRHTLSKWMRRLLRPLDIDGSHRWLRYTFSTVGSQVVDDHARAVVNGHVVDGVPENYVLDFPEARLLAVTDHVRHWVGFTASDEDRLG